MIDLSDEGDADCGDIGRYIHQGVLRDSATMLIKLV